MNFSRQALLGVGMVVGGSVMLYAMAQQLGGSNEPEPISAIVDNSSATPASMPPLTTDIDTEKRILAQKQQERAARVAEQEHRAQQFLAEQEHAETQALAKARAENQKYIDNITVTDDADSQKAILTPPLQARTESTATPAKTSLANNSASSQKAAQLQAQQDAKKQAEAERQAAIKKRADIAKKAADLKAETEAQLAAAKQAEAKKQADTVAKKKAEEQLIVKQKAETEAKAKEQAAKKEPPKSPTDYTVKRGDGLIKLAREYNIPVAVLAQANNLSPATSLQLGQTLKIPSRKQIQRLEREAAAAEVARENQKALDKKTADARRDAQIKLREARQEVKATDAKGSFGVQVSLASNQAAADDIAKKFRAAGYTVTTSPTSRGVRVTVGPERGKIAALALKDKINSDPKVNTTGAWVRYW